MNNIIQRSLFWILTLSIIGGELLKLPLPETNSGATFLDLAVILTCLSGLINLKFKLKKPPPYLLAALIFTTITTLSLILTPLNLTINQYLLSFSYTVRFLIYISMGWILYSGALPLFQKRLTDILILSGFGLALLGLVQFILLPDLKFLIISGWDPHYQRAVSTLLDPNFLGAYSVLTLLLLYQQYKLKSKTNIAIFIIIFSVLLITFSRSSYLMFAVGFTTFSVLLKSIKLLLLTALLTLLLLSGFSFYNKTIASPKGINRTESANLRLSTWQQGLRIFSRNPLLGVGFNSYRFALKQYYLTNNQLLQSRGSSSNDSSLLFVLSTTGLIGLSSYLVFIWLLIYKHWKNPFIIAGLAALLVHSFFVNSLFYPFVLVWFTYFFKTPLLINQKK